MLGIIYKVGIMVIKHVKVVIVEVVVLVEVVHSWINEALELMIGSIVMPFQANLRLMHHIQL